MHILIGLADIVIKVQTHKWHNELQSSAGTNHHYKDF